MHSLSMRIQREVVLVIGSLLISDISRLLFPVQMTLWSSEGNEESGGAVSVKEVFVMERLPSLTERAPCVV